MAPRWCVCAGLRATSCALEIDVLMHHREVWRPSSTGHVINRTFPASRHHLWRRERGMKAEELRVPGRELWVLHPRGETMPMDAKPENVQVVLIDGSWREAAAMSQEIAGWGRLVSLPMAARTTGARNEEKEKGMCESRYWLRDQAEGGKFSTAEALMFLLGEMGQEKERAALELQLELHVYASLRARGAKERAEEFLESSPVLEKEMGELIAAMKVRRARED